MKKILTIVGARPQFVKAAALSRAIKAQGGLDEILVHTGQHFDPNMSQVFFDQMEIPQPDYNLEINSLGHGAMTGRMLESIEKVLVEESPDVVVVFGDTNSTLAGALAAKKLHIKLAHVEAGLRSFNMLMPEEINRILTDRISDYLFCPTKTAVENLVAEGFENFPSQILNVGDVMYDAALYYEPKADSESKILESLNYDPRAYVLCTFHRQENTDNPENFKSIVSALNEINSQIKVLVPIHPRTSKLIKDAGLTPEFKMIDPVGYFDMIQLIKGAELILTDSGGLQKEAFFFNKYCITLREETEWVELVENGYNTLVGANENRIIEAFQSAQEITSRKLLYGDGKASGKIIEALLN